MLMNDPIEQVYAYAFSEEVEEVASEGAEEEAAGESGLGEDEEEGDEEEGEDEVEEATV